MSQNKDSFIHYKLYQLSSVFSHVWLSATQWLSGCETCMSISNSWSLLKLIELVMPHNHLDLCRSLLLLPSVFPSIRVFSNDSFFTSDGQNIGASASVLSLNIQDWSPLRWSVWSAWSPRDSQESSPTPQFESINSSMLSFLCGPTLTSVCDYRKNRRFE